MGSALSFLFGGPAAAATEDTPPSSAEDSLVKSFHSSARWQLQHRELEESPKLAVIDFTASWCGPCKMMAPVFHGLADKFSDVQFFKIDVDELPDVAQDFGVQAMPTFVLLKRGKEVDRVVGAKKEELEKKIDKCRRLEGAA